MSDKPTVSVVIPLYNKGPYISRALNSVLKQTSQNFEIIVVDGGSTDDGVAIVRRFNDPRILLIKQEKQGVSEARNQGIEKAKAEFIAFLDADDEWMPDHLETLLRLSANYPKAGLYSTAFLKMTKSCKVKLGNYYEIPKKPWEGLIQNYFKSSTFGSPPAHTSFVGIPRTILMEMHGFNSNAWFGEDSDLWGRIALKYPVAFSWNGMGIWHMDVPNRLSGRREPIEEDIFSRTARDLIEADQIPRNMHLDLLEYIIKKNISIASRNLSIGEPRMAREILIKCAPKSKGLIRLKYIMLFLSYAPARVYSLVNYIYNNF